MLFPIDKITAINRDVNSYQYMLSTNSGYVQQGTVQVAPLFQHVTLSLHSEGKADAEIFWQGTEGIGRTFAANTWTRLSGKPTPNYLALAIDHLQSQEPRAISEEQGSWFLHYDVQNAPILTNPVDYFQRMLGEPKDKQSRTFFTKMVELAQRATANLVIKVSQDSHLIQQVESTAQVADFHKTLTIAFEPSQEEIPAFPQVSLGAMKEWKIPAHMLLFRYDKLGGWNEGTNHTSWTQRSIDLIEQSDRHLRYRELYDRSWYREKFTGTIQDPPSPDNHHPLVIGSYYEDYTEEFPQFYRDWFHDNPYVFDNPNFHEDGYMRDFHHFGGDNHGLEHQWYFIFRYFQGKVPATTVDDRYYSARDWGYGGNRIDPSLNHMTFTEAIQQYNHYTWKGKRNALLLLGHVIHLLQDTGHPDHASMTDHAASGKTQREAYETFKYCHIVATEHAAAACGICGPACIPCMAAAFGIAEAACYSSIDDHIMGYERLVKEFWQEIEDGISIQIDVPTINSYDTVFHEMAAFAIEKTEELNLESPLGCGALTFAPVPGTAPEIDSSDEAARMPYIELTKQILPKLIGYGARLIEYFYEIVNHPPFVQRVVMVQGPIDLAPQNFGRLEDPQHATTMVYDGKWISEGAIKRVKQIHINEPLNPDQPTYLFLQFGPTLPPIGSKTIQEKTLKVDFTNSIGINIDVQMIAGESDDSEIGTYYWGRIEPFYVLGRGRFQLEIQAQDASAHLKTRSQPGDELDSNPATIACVNIETSPLYQFDGYEPGTDSNHFVEVASSQQFEAIIAWQIMESGKTYKIKDEQLHLSPAIIAWQILEG